MSSLSLGSTTRIIQPDVTVTDVALTDGLIEITGTHAFQAGDIVQASGIGGAVEANGKLAGATCAIRSAAPPIQYIPGSANGRPLTLPEFLDAALARDAARGITSLTGKVAAGLPLVDPKRTSALKHVAYEYHKATGKRIDFKTVEGEYQRRLQNSSTKEEIQ